MALKDALVIIVLIAVLRSNTWLKKYPQLLVVFGILFSIAVEVHALQTGRWTYTDAMPLIPFLGTGLTPTIQIGLLSYIVYSLVFPHRHQAQN
ncbi:MAG: hypothetical protein AAB490_05665 [Patescibacteria group bacterium]